MAEIIKDFRKESSAVSWIREHVSRKSRAIFFLFRIWQTPMMKSGAFGRKVITWRVVGFKPWSGSNWSLKGMFISDKMRARMR